MGRHRALIGLLLSYLLISFSVYGIWEWRGWYPPTGDEPHHIVIGRSILHHGSLEQTPAYRDEFARNYLGHPGDAITRSNAHVVPGPRGLFSVHSVGTGLISVLPIAFSELLGYDNDVPFIKSFFVLLSGFAVIAAWVLASLYLRSTSARVLAVLVTCMSLPLVIAANQVFPDLPAGVIGVCVLSWLAWSSIQPATPLWQHFAMMCLVTCLPWLHYKFSVMAAILGLAVLVAGVRKGMDRRRLLILCIVPGVGMAAFFFYNTYAFGSLLPFHPSTSVRANARALMWFLALHLDRFHGFLLQNPAYFVGMLFLVPFVMKQRLVGIPTLLTYLTVIGINAANGAPGYSFAGRFTWTGCMCLMPATLYGLGCLENLSRRAYFGTGAVLLSLQVVAIAPLLITKHDLYNPYRPVWFDVYPSFFPEITNRFLPAFYDQGWWYQYGTNYVFILVTLLLIGIGAWIYPRRREQTLLMTGGLLSLAVPAVVLVGFVQPSPPRKQLVFSAASLARHFGLVRENAVMASVDAHDAGIWTFGPYIRLARGTYRVRIHTQSDAADNVKVGSWDVTGRAGSVRLAAGDVLGTAGKRGETEGLFRISSSGDGEDLEVRLFFDDVADLLFVDAIVEPTD